MSAVLSRLTFWVTKVLELAIVACLAVMGVLVFGNVVLRYVFSTGIAWSEELSRLLFVWLIFLGAILASRQHAHIGFDTLVRKLPAKWKKFVLLVCGALMSFGCALFVSGGWEQTRINLDNSYPVLGISYGWLYGSSVVFGTGMILSILANLWEAVMEPGSDDDLVLTLNLGERIEAGMSRVAADDDERGGRNAGGSA